MNGREGERNGAPLFPHVMAQWLESLPRELQIMVQVLCQSEESSTGKVRNGFYPESP